MQQDNMHPFAALLRRAGSAHGIYEERELGGVYDQQWPQWYAAYLLDNGLATFVTPIPTTDQVARWLAACDAAYRAGQPLISWPEYYAARIGDLQAISENS